MNPILLALAYVLLFPQAPTNTQSGNEAYTILEVRETATEVDVQPLPEKSRTSSVVESNRVQLEQSAAFKKAAGDAWHATHNGTAHFETGFAIGKDGRPGKLQSSIFAPYEAAHHLQISFSTTDIGTFHVHNKYGDPKPSPHDIQIAKTTHKMVYVSSREGLYCVDPNGNVRHLSASETWFDRK